MTVPTHLHYTADHEWVDLDGEHATTTGVTAFAGEALASPIPGSRVIYGGGLRNAHLVEGLKAKLISINRRHKVHAGVRVTDV